MPMLLTNTITNRIYCVCMFLMCSGKKKSLNCVWIAASLSILIRIHIRMHHKNEPEHKVLVKIQSPLSHHSEAFFRNRKFSVCVLSIRLHIVASRPQTNPYYIHNTELNGICYCSIRRMCTVRIVHDFL